MVFRNVPRGLPDNKNPTGTRCIQIDIPDDDDWERGIYGEVYRLTRWYLWERDAGKFGKPVADRWLKALATWRHCDGSPGPFNHGMEVEEDLGLRIDCDCNVFVTCCDGTEKQILTADQVKAIAGGQPGPGTAPPGPGQCRDYSVTLQAGGSYLIPVLVNTGDVVTLDTLDGATSDVAPIGRWNCPDGDVFIGGTCQGVPVFDSGALLPGSPIGIPVFYVNGVYYSALTPLIVPGGVANQPIAIQINYAPGGAFAGALTGHLRVCNNQAGTWSHDFDFTAGPDGWFPYDTGSGVFLGVLTLGVGYTQSDGVAFGGNARGVAITVHFDARTLTRITVHFSYTTGVVDSGGSVLQNVASADVNFILHHLSDVVAGSNVVDSGSAVDPGQTDLRLQYLSDLTAGSPSGVVQIHGITVEGVGTDPF